MADTCDLLVLDGGLSNALEGRGHDLSTDAWTARLPLDVHAAASWVEEGARLVGGCCRVGPDRIAALATHLKG